MRNQLSILAVIVLSILIAISVIRCDGGGGGDAPAELTYSGNTNAAVITLKNATTLVANVLYAGESSTNLPVSISASDDALNTSGISVQSEIMSNISKVIRGSIYGDDFTYPKAVIGIVVNEPLACDYGTGSVSGTLSDTDGTGILTFTFSNCVIEGITYNGTGQYIVDYFDFSYLLPTDVQIVFTLMSINGLGFNGSASGSIRYQTEISTNTETMTLNYVAKDNIIGKMYKYENVIVTTTYDNYYSPSNKSVTYTGAPARTYDSVHGFVDIDTSAALKYSSATLIYPDMDGVVILTGAAGSSIRVTVLSGESLQLELDIDGVPGYEESRVIPWGDLALNAGTDLTGTDAVNVLQVTLSGTGQASSGLSSNSYYGQTFKLEESGTAERLTVYISNTGGIDFRILLVEVQTVPDFRPTNVLSESVTLSAPAAAIDELNPVTASLGSIKLNAGQTYAFILDGYVEYDGSSQSAFVATINGAYPDIMSFTTSVTSGTRDEHFLNSFWYTDTQTDISFILEYKPE